MKKDDLTFWAQAVFVSLLFIGVAATLTIVFWSVIVGGVIALLKQAGVL